MDPDSKFKRILIHSMKQIHLDDDTYDKDNYLISYVGSHCLRKLQLDRFPDAYGLTVKEQNVAMLRMDSLEENRLGAAKLDAVIQKFVETGVVENLKSQSNTDLEIQTEGKVVLTIDGITLVGKYDLLLQHPFTGEKIICKIKTIKDTTSKLSLPKGAHLDQLLLYQKAYGGISGFLIYITRDIGEVLMYRQDYSEERISAIISPFKNLREYEGKGVLAPPKDSASDYPCSYYCKWADYCWNDEAIPPLRYLLS